ncbi:MAG: hypothetical protein QW101_07150 [Ignisphaera sp.]
MSIGLNYIIFIIAGICVTKGSCIIKRSRDIKCDLYVEIVYER